MVIAGIDTGLSGYVAIRDSGMVIYKVPLIGDTLNCKELQDILIRHKVAHCFLEKAHSMPKQGIASTFKFGYVYGLLEATCKLTTKLEIVHSKTWKNLILKGTAKDKDAAVAFVNSLYPEITFKYKYEHNKADAICIAEYGYRILVKS